MNNSHLDILVGPRVSEKSAKLAGMNKFVFKVKPSANKLQIKKALEAFYGVKIASVNVVRNEGKGRTYGGRVGKTSDFKKAIVTLTKDSKALEIGAK